MKLQFGSGRDRKEGYINCDISKEMHPDKIVDLEKKLPFKKDSVDEIVANHVLEHVKNLLPLFKEMHRICRKGAIVKIRVPYFAHESAFSMMDHVRFFTYTTFDALDKNHACHWMSTGNFRVVSKKLVWRPNIFCFFNLFPKVYQNFFCWMFPAKELQVILKVIKD